MSCCGRCHGGGCSRCWRRGAAPTACRPGSGGSSTSPRSTASPQPPTRRPCAASRPTEVADLDKTFSPVSRTTNSTCERVEHELTPQRLKWRLQCKGQLDMDVAGEFVFETRALHRHVVAGRDDGALMHDPAAIEGSGSGSAVGIDSALNSSRPLRPSIFVFRDRMSNAPCELRISHPTIRRRHEDDMRHSHAVGVAARRLPPSPGRSVPGSEEAYKATVGSPTSSPRPSGFNPSAMNCRARHPPQDSGRMRTVRRYQYMVLDDRWCWSIRPARSSRS